ncbi:type II secretion system F family protein [Ornithinimicrobium cavernae]|uniref:type II secretion system F family protein n=1 Tax=Ornithinimicrobium cavernae TaxID=2666047 RepID=UPI000D694F8A|nr:type II secretion system F family protein [Ornithinimicrobium cavernae]
MTGLQLVIAAGSLVGLGLTVLLWRWVPAEPDLGETLNRLSPAGARSAQAHRTRQFSRSDDVRDVLGTYGERVLPARVWGSVSSEDLAILRITPTRYYGEKLLFAFIGLLSGPMLTIVPMIAWSGIPIYVPVVASLGLAAGLWFLPNYNVLDDARKARLEFSRALGAFIDLVALERAAGSGPRQAMEAAATAGDSWVFRRISEELARTRWSGTTPWEAMRQLGDEFGVVELHELADIVRLSGEEGAQIYGQLRARAASMRSAMLIEQKAEANKVSERMVLPTSLMVLIFLALLLTPQMLRLLGG